MDNNNDNKNEKELDQSEQLDQSEKSDQLEQPEQSEPVNMVKGPGGKMMPENEFWEMMRKAAEQTEAELEAERATSEPTFVFDSSLYDAKARSMDEYEDMLDEEEIRLMEEDGWSIEALSGNEKYREQMRYAELASINVKIREYERVFDRSPFPERDAPNKITTAKTKSVVARIGILFLAMVVAFSGAFYAMYFVCRTALLGDSEFFAAFMAKWAGVTQNRVEVDYITGEYKGENIDLANKILGYTLVVRTVSTDTETGKMTTLSQGSGVIYSVADNGVVLAVTNYHVIENGGRVIADTVGGDRYDCKVKAVDISSDIAVLEFTTDKTYTQPGHADSSKLKYGQSVAVCGNPLGHGFSVSFGYVASPNSGASDAVGSYIQLDVSVNPGNSGGGVYDSLGNLVGVVVSKASGENVDGLGYAIPINKVNEVVNDLLTYGYVQGRPALGITVVNVVTASQYEYYRSNDLKDHLKETLKDNYRYGVYIVGKREGSTSPLRIGDRILAVDGVKVVASESIGNAISNLAPGTAVKILVERLENGEYVQVTESVVLSSRDWADEIPNE